VNKKQSQSGSAHLVVIIVLVAALIGALGFVFYQNFMVAKTETPAPTPVVVADSEAKMVSITEWGVKGGYTSKQTLTSNLQGTRFNFQSAVTAGTDCNSAGYLGIIDRYSANDTLPEPGYGVNMTAASFYQSADYYDRAQDSFKKIGEYYYVYTPSQAACANAGEANTPLLDAQIEINSSIKELFTSLEAI